MKDNPKRTDFGYYAETAVCKYLEKKGCSILKRNFRIKGGEIDIIAASDSYIYFIEVKYRTRICDFEGAIDNKKQQRIIKAAEKYIKKTGCMLQPRFDAAFVSSDRNGVSSLKYISNAFDASDV